MVMRITYQCQPNVPGEDLAYHVAKTLSQGVLEAVLQQLQSTQMSLKSTAKSKSCPDLRKKEAKYRRMRDLNNAASKRCRVNRKRKFEEMETEVQREEARNAKLKIQMEALEIQVDNFKKMIIDMIKTKKHNQQITVQQQQASIEEFDIDTLVKNTLE